jgi:hypothetical protein
MCRGIRRFTLWLGSDVVQALVWRGFQDGLPQGVAQAARLITRFCDKRQEECNGGSTTTQGKWSRREWAEGSRLMSRMPWERGGTSGYLSGSAPCLLVLALVQSQNGGTSAQRLGYWKLTCPRGSLKNNIWSGSLSTTFATNCRTIWVQPNVPFQPAIITPARPSKHHATVTFSSSSRKTTSQSAHTTLKRAPSRDRRVQHT